MMSNINGHQICEPNQTRNTFSIFQMPALAVSLLSIRFEVITRRLDSLRQGHKLE